MSKVAIISAFSFFRPGPRVGMQFIAQILARNGFDVHYLSQPSSPVDLLSAPRRPRFQRAWLGKETCRQVEEHLSEYFVRAPYPVNRKFWLLPGQHAWYGGLLPRELKNMRFDLCLHDMSSCFPLLEHLSFRTLILRLSDHPQGFSYVAPGVMIRKLTQDIAGGRYAQIWPASRPLLDYVRQLQPGGRHVLVSNGVDYGRFMQALSAPAPEARTAVFVGSLDRWVDAPLLDQAARLLPDWRIDLWGPALIAGTFTADNITFKGPVEHSRLPEVLGRYQVGLIPFRRAPLVAVMERPLKFYEYLAAGLGVASTSAGELGRGMAGWARFGDTPQAFAAAILQAAGDSRHRLAERHAFLQDFSWDRIGKVVLDCLGAAPRGSTTNGDGACVA